MTFSLGRSQCCCCVIWNRRNFDPCSRAS